MNTLLSLNAAVSCYYLMAIVLLLALGSVEATPASCSAQPPAKLCCYKTQLLFLLDRSATQAITNITEPINFMKRARCFFEEGRVQTGLIVFNRDVKTVIPLGNYSADDWYTALDNAVPTIQPTSRFTPMAEAFWLARRTFEQNPDSPCDPINRVVVLMSDGFPVQNMPPKNSGDTVFGIGGDAGIPTTYLSKPASSGANLALIGDYAEYNEHWVPYEAKRLKEETGSRIITVAMKGTDTLSARVSYFTGEIDPTYACRNPSTPPTRSPTVVPAPTSKPVSNMPACVAGQSPETTQCYRRRVVRSAVLQTDLFEERYERKTNKPSFLLHIKHTQHKKTGTVADPGDGVANGYGGTVSFVLLKHEP